MAVTAISPIPGITLVYRPPDLPPSAEHRIRLFEKYARALSLLHRAHEKFNRTGPMHSAWPCRIQRCERLIALSHRLQDEYMKAVAS